MKTVLVCHKGLVVFLSIFTLMAWAIAPYLGTARKVMAAHESHWTNSEPLDITVNDGAFTPQECTQVTAKVKKYTWPFDRWVRTKDATTEGCGIQTPLGLIIKANGGMYVQFAGSDYAQMLVDAGFQGIGGIAVPGSKTIVSGGGMDWNTNNPYKTHFFYNIAAAGESVVHGGE